MFKKLMVFTAVGLSFASPAFAMVDGNVDWQPSRKLEVGQIEKLSDYNGASLGCAYADKVLAEDRDSVAKGSSGAGVAR